MRAATFALVTLFALSSQTARAALVRVDFSGSVDTIEGQLYPPGTPIPTAEAEALLGGSIHVGTRFSGFFLYDDSTVASDGYPEGGGVPPFAAWALYFPGPGLGPTAGSHGEIGSYVGDGPGAGSIDVNDNELLLVGADPSRLFVTSAFVAGSSPAGGIPLLDFWVYAAGAGPGSPLHGTSLVGIPWDLESFPSTSVVWHFRDGDTYVSVTGTVDHLVPEAPAFGLLALAACAMLAARAVRRGGATWAISSSCRPVRSTSAGS